ncbi:MAG: GntR family transcriptional regulator [Fulvivirga sp.]
MDQIINISINNASRIPKYKQVVDSILEDISKGGVKVGQKIPSINEISEECNLSRDTVEKAYKVLKERKIIVSVKGKGYYVSKTNLVTQVKILFMLNKLSSYKMRIYNAFVNSLGANAQVDLRVYHCDDIVFLNMLEEYEGVYDYYVIMPHFKNRDHQHIGYTDDILKAISKIPVDKLLLMDYFLPELKGDFAAVYQDFKADIYEVLNEGIDNLHQYEKLILVYPSQSVYPYPKEIAMGFKKFCMEQDIDYEVLDEIYDDMELQSKDAYLVIEDTDLVNLVKQTRDKKFELGKDIGIICYNDTPLKDLLGITVISTDFDVMGETAAYMISKNKKEKVKNAFKLINRNSF